MSASPTAPQLEGSSISTCRSCPPISRLIQDQRGKYYIDPGHLVHRHAPDAHTCHHILGPGSPDLKNRRTLPDPRSRPIPQGEAQIKHRTDTVSVEFKWQVQWKIKDRVLSRGQRNLAESDPQAENSGWGRMPKRSRVLRRAGESSTNRIKAPTDRSEEWYGSRATW